MDPNQNQYSNDLSIIVLNICRQVFAGWANKYLLGIPSQPLTDLDYPAVVVQKLTSNIDVGATMSDDENERIAIMFFSNKNDQAGDTNDPGITAMRELQNYIEGKKQSLTSPSYGEWQTNTLAYQLRYQLDLGAKVTRNALQINYATQARTSETGAPLTSICSATITMTFTEIVLVPNRN